MASIKDVAELAGVSRATVSRVMNNTGQISEPTRLRVEKAMSDLNYRPNPIARSLATSSSKTVGLVVTSYRGSFFSELMGQVQEQVDNHGRFLLVARSKRDQDSERQAIERLEDMRCEGLIIHARNLDEDELRHKAKAGAPFILLDRLVEGIENRCVAYEHEKAGYMAVSHLIENGHRKIACLAGIRTRLTAQLRFQGYQQALAENGIAFDENLVAEGDYDRQGGYAAMKAILDRHPDITAVYSCSEEMCVGAFDVFRERNIAVPEQVSVVSFDSVSVCTILKPQVTTVHFPIREMADEASAQLFRLISNNSKSVLPAPDVFQPELRVRHSVRAL